MLWTVRLVEFCELEIAYAPQGPEGDKVAPRTPGGKGDKWDPGTPGPHPRDDPELQYEECMKYWSRTLNLGQFGNFINDLAGYINAINFDIILPLLIIQIWSHK